jgi:hypothetical protein
LLAENEALVVVLEANSTKEMRRGEWLWLARGGKLSGQGQFMTARRFAQGEMVRDKRILYGTRKKEQERKMHDGD